jgi:multiple sugar transport system substrate-binding protein
MRARLTRRGFIMIGGSAVAATSVLGLAACGSPAPTPTTAPAKPAAADSSAAKPAAAPTTAAAAPTTAAAAPTTAAAAAAPTTAAAPTSAAAAAPTTAAKPAAEATKPAAGATAAAKPAADAKPGTGGAALPYAARPLVGGRPVEMEAWDWHQPRMEIWKIWFKEYSETQKNTSFTITQVPRAEYPKKLQAAIPAGQAPDLFYFHNNEHTILADTELIDPLPDERFPRNVLNNNFLGMKEGHTTDKVKRLPRYMITGVMSGGIYYNKELWAKAGLKESDLPKTWDDVVEKAKVLTQRDAGGRINVAGFAFNGEMGAQFGYLRYQQGELTYSADGKKARYNTPGVRKSLQWFLDCYDQHKVNSRDFLPARDAFKNGKAAMFFSWSWGTGDLNVNAKNLDWGIVASPTWTGKLEPAVGPNNFDPLSFVVPATGKPDKKEVAWDYIQWMYGTDERILQHALIAPSPPAVKGLGDHPKVQADPTLKALTAQTPYTIFASGGPQALGQSFTKMLDNVYKANMSIDEALKGLQAEADQLVTKDDYSAVAARERAYLNASMMQQD